MNVLLDQREIDAERVVPLPLPLARMDIRHLVFDMCASHELRANGVYNVARQLASEQIAAGETASIVFLREEGRDMPSDPGGPPMRVLGLRGRKVRGRRVGIDRAVLDAMVADARAPLFFHIHAARQPLLLPIVARLRKLGIPYAMTIHGLYSHVFDRHGRPMRRLSPHYLRLVERHVLQGARFVQGVSAAECALVRRIAPRARVELVPNAAYSSRLERRPAAPARNGPSAGFPVFGFLGRYEIEHKGLDLLIAGFAAYRGAGGTGRLELVGTGPAREKIVAHARTLGVAAHVAVDGPRYGADKARTLAAWDYFVMPSRFEGVPIGALEAGLAGLPLIVSAETGLREEVTSSGGGIGIVDLTPAAVAQALLDAQRCTAADWSRMSEAAYGLALAMGDWTRIAATLAGLYRRE
jgi:glycosyltransferase involved in cell wall biosynthesis